MDNRSGMTMLEIVLVLAIMGILLGAALVILPNDHLQVNQAAQGLAQQFTRARLEAIKNDRFAGITLSTSGAGSYAVCVAQPSASTCASGDEIQTVTFGSGATAKVKLASTPFTAFMFDPRGIPVSGTSGSITLSNTAGTYQAVIAVTAAGRAAVQ